MFCYKILMYILFTKQSTVKDGFINGCINNAHFSLACTLFYPLHLPAILNSQISNLNVNLLVNIYYE